MDVNEALHPWTYVRALHPNARPYFRTRISNALAQLTKTRTLNVSIPEVKLFSVSFASRILRFLMATSSSDESGRSQPANTICLVDDSSSPFFIHPSDNVNTVVAASQLNGANYIAWRRSGASETSSDSLTAQLTSLHSRILLMRSGNDAMTRGSFAR
ncbi:hypothetical protein M569_00015 [Genlisea aurea]|uniref:Retrotransposon Copia-like N-terminal domain-containing protein n=1 Tax=Genlisea aurea TaxID=192259 RepID=S8D5P2_9LAMI|nr:hypothetical protein M569_00015 [Genlisea aurea]